MPERERVVTTVGTQRYADALRGDFIRAFNVLFHTTYKGEVHCGTLTDAQFEDLARRAADEQGIGIAFAHDDAYHEVYLSTNWASPVTLTLPDGTTVTVPPSARWTY